MTGTLTGRPVDLDSLSLEAIAAGALADRAVTVLGLARTGLALTRFFVDAGAAVTAYDVRRQAELERGLSALEGRPLRLLAGPQVDPWESLAGADLVAHSPSISAVYPTTEPRLRAALAEIVAARSAGDRTRPPLVSEPELVLRLCPAPTVGVTGTKGKTTTAALTAACLEGDPLHPVVLGGNMGEPLIDRLTEVGGAHRVVVELSDLQLVELSRGTTVAVYTNVTSDHLDRHGSVLAYRAAKRRLAELVDPAGALVLNLDDPVVASFERAGRARSVTYRLARPRAGGIGLEGGWIVAASVRPLDSVDGGAAGAGLEGRVLPVAELQVPGRHSVRNAMAAVAVGGLFGIPADAIRAAGARFGGVEHRLQTVAVVDGVRFVNDSMGTQPDAVIAALEAFPPPIVLIAGGRDKGVDLDQLAGVVARRVSAAVVIGENGAALGRLFASAGLGRIEQSPGLELAVERADAIAREILTERDRSNRRKRVFEPVTVLLSPAAASFDMFVDYADRGRVFVETVRQLAARRARDGARVHPEGHFR